MLLPKSLFSLRTANAILIVLLISLAICVILLGSVPPTSRDALTHHLYLPKLYIQHGGIFQIPNLSWSYYPMNLDLLYTVPLYFGNDIVPNYIHFFFAIATSWLIYWYLRNKTGRTFGLIGSLFFLSIPIILKLSITAYVDLGLIFFSTASFLFLLKWVEEGFKIHNLLLSGIFCGLAVGTKYNGLITLFILTLIIPILYSRAHDSLLKKRPNSIHGIVSSGIFSLIALICFSPWIIKNYIWTNNPIFPLFDGWFNHQTNPIQNINHLDIFSSRQVLFNESGLQILLLPLRIFFEGKDNAPQFFDGVLNPFLLVLPLLAFFKPSRNQSLEFEKYAMLSFVILYFLFASLESSMRIRYISPIIPMLVILSIFGMVNLLTYSKMFFSSINPNYSNTVIIVIVITMLGINIDYLIKQFIIIQPISYLSGKVDREQYVSHFLPEFPVISFINKTLPLDTKIFALYLGNRGYYFDRPVEFDLQSGKSKFFDIVNQSDSGQNVLDALRSEGFKYLVVRYDLFNNQSQRLLSLEKQSLIVSFFQNSTQKIFENSKCGLFKLGLDDTLIGSPISDSMEPSKN